jgi:hypothetical protein
VDHCVNSSKVVFFRQSGTLSVVSFYSTPIQCDPLSSYLTFLIKKFPKILLGFVNIYSAQSFRQLVRKFKINGHYFSTTNMYQQRIPHFLALVAIGSAPTATKPTSLSLSSSFFSLSRRKRFGREYWSKRTEEWKPIQRQENNLGFLYLLLFHDFSGGLGDPGGPSEGYHGFHDG